MTITWKIGGEAGFGIMTTGVMFSRLATRHGYHIFDYVEYPSLIRGGHNVYQVAVGDGEVLAQEKGVDLLFCLNQETIDLHEDELKPDSLIAYDQEHMKVEDGVLANRGVIIYTIPFVRLTKEAGATKVMENNVALGASAALLSMDLSILNQLIADTFVSKGEKIVSANQTAAKLGYDYVLHHPAAGFKQILRQVKTDKKIVITGNEAVVLGAIAGGCKFYVAYPMTPTSNALHAMAEWGPKYGVLVKHAEDEISVINMAIGAAYAGVRSMTGTAGGGFSLMVEGLGLAGMTETPLVIYTGQRPGPATGMPTWTSQGDLKFLINASQDEFPRFILAPGDVAEAFYLTAEAFNLADIYQTPVFILSDKYLAESHQSVPWFDLSKLVVDRGKLISWERGDILDGYLRYKLTDDGIPERALPGMKRAVFTANSYEHDEYGWSSESAKVRFNQVNRRHKKIQEYIKFIPEPKIYGEDEADLTLVAWGSTKGPILAALASLKSENSSSRVNLIHLNHIWPFPRNFIKDKLTGAKKILLVEGNSQAQLGTLIEEQTGIHIENSYLKYDGRPFYPEDVFDKIKQYL